MMAPSHYLRYFLLLRIPQLAQCRFLGKPVHLPFQNMICMTGSRIFRLNLRNVGYFGKLHIQLLETITHAFVAVE